MVCCRVCCVVMWDGYVKKCFSVFTGIFWPVHQWEEIFGNKDQNFLIEVQQTVVFLVIYLLQP